MLPLLPASLCTHDTATNGRSTSTAKGPKQTQVDESQSVVNTVVDADFDTMVGNDNSCARGHHRRMDQKQGLVPVSVTETAAATQGRQRRGVGVRRNPPTHSHSKAIVNNSGFQRNRRTQQSTPHNECYRTLIKR